MLVDMDFDHWDARRGASAQIFGPSSVLVDGWGLCMAQVAARTGFTFIALLTQDFCAKSWVQKHARSDLKPAQKL